MPRQNKILSFTLLETLIVIGILAALAVTIILIMNPSELLKETRDSTRLSDLRNVHTALKLYEIDQSSGFLGTSSIVYVSLPDTTTTCANLGLPSLPDGWSYNCVTSANLRKIDGLGWIPVNFASITYNSPIGKLPTDPINTTSSGNYYTYVTGGSWEMTALLESNQYKMGGSNDAVSQDGGQYPEVYEFGSSLKMTPVNRDPNLVGYWRFNETGTSTYDSSGHSNNGTMYSSTTITDLHTSDGCVSGSCGSFNGTSDYVLTTKVIPLSTNNVTISLWVKGSPMARYAGLVYSRGSPTFGLNTTEFPLNNLSYTWGNIYGWNSGFVVSQTEMNFVVLVITSTNATIYFGNSSGLSSSINTQAHSALTLNTPFRFGVDSTGVPMTRWWNGTMDDVRIYNRALSAAEIQAIYNSTQ